MEENLYQSGDEFKNSVVTEETRNSNFIVTEKSICENENDICFFCGRKIGNYHKVDCPLILKKVLVRAYIDYHINVPSYWDTKTTAAACADENFDDVYNELIDTERTYSGDKDLTEAVIFKCIHIDDNFFLDEEEC